MHSRGWQYLATIGLNLLLFFTVSLTGFAEEKGASISGRVLDTQRRVVTNATVALSGVSLPQSVTVSTSSAGEFTFVDLAPGAYSIHISAAGFADAHETVSLTPAQNLRREIVLRLPSVQETVQVIDKLPVYVDTLDMSELRESPAKDVGEALEKVDGVWKIRKGGIANDVVVRGFQQNNIVVTIDGARIYGACPGHMDPTAQHVDFAEVERVDVVKGAFNVEDQGSLGATVRIVNKQPADGLQITPSFSSGSFGFYNPTLTGSYGNDKFKALAGYSYRVSNPYKDGSGRPFTSYANYSAAAQDRNAFDIQTGWFSTEFAPTANQKLSLSYTRQQSGLVLYPYLTMDSDYDNADRAGLKYSIKDVSGNIRALRVQTYFTQVNHFMSDSQRTSAQNGSWTMASQATTRTIGGRVETDLGRDLTFGFESYYRNWNVLGTMRTATMLMLNSTVPNVDTRTYGTFAEYHHSFSDRLRMSGGLRFDHASMRVMNPNASTDLYFQFANTRRTSNVDNYPSGNLQFSYSLRKTAQLFVGLGSTARIPDAEERYISRKSSSATNVGDPLLPSTRNTELTAGLNLTHGGSYIKPVLFYSHLDDYIVVNNQQVVNMSPAPMGGTGSGNSMATTPPSARSYTNVHARIYGGEVSYALAINDGLSVTGGTSYSRGTNDLKPRAGVLSSSLPEMPPLRSWLAVRYVVKSYFMELGATALDRQSHVDTDLLETVTPGSCTMSVRLGGSYRKLRAMFVVDNLLNKFYYENLSYYRDPFRSGARIPEPGRTVFAQASYRF